VAADEPGRRRRGRGGEIDRDPVRPQEIDDAVEPAEVVHTLFGLEQRPREDADRGDPDTRFAHQLDVL